MSERKRKNKEKRKTKGRRVAKGRGREVTIEREGMRKREIGGRVGWLRGGETSVVRSYVLSVFSVSLDIPSTKQQSPRPPPATSRGRTRSPSRAGATLPRPVSSLYPSLSRIRTQTHTDKHAQILSPSRACVRTYTRPEDHIEDEQGEFSSRWERLEGRRAPVLVGRRRVGGWGEGAEAPPPPSDAVPSGRSTE